MRKRKTRLTAMRLDEKLYNDFKNLANANFESPVLLLERFMSEYVSQKKVKKSKK